MKRSEPIFPLEEQRSVPIEEAKASGATMLFGEKYGDAVRIITFDKANSTELCGGTHVPATAQIGQFRIVAESSVAAGIRRIEAVTAEKADALTISELKELNAVKAQFKTAKNIAQQVEQVLEENKQLKKKVEQLVAKQANALKGTLLSQAETINDIKLIIAKPGIGDSNALKNPSLSIRERKRPDNHCFWR